MFPKLRRLTIYTLTAIALLLGVTLGLSGGQSPVPTGKLAAMVILLVQAAMLVGPVWLAAAGYGEGVRRLLVPTARGRWVLRLGLGMGTLLGLHWVMATLGGVGMVRAWGLVAVGIALAGWFGWAHQRDAQASGRPPASLRSWPWLTPLLAPAVGLALVAVVCPPGTLWRVEAFGYDVLSYHLQLPKEWLAAGRMGVLHHNVYSYFPNLIENGYLMLGAMRGSMLGAVYACQVLHYSLALLTAGAVAELVSRFFDRGAMGRTAGTIGAAVLLSVPWVGITGTLAYDEMGMLAFAAVALVVALDPASETARGAAAVGLLCGLATLAKLPAGPMLAVPIGLLLLTRLNHALRWRQAPRWPVGIKAAGIAAGVGAVTLLPWMGRNALDSGNPVFPFATSVFGLGHWTPGLAARWATAHGLAFSHESVWDAIGRQWLFNTGYGAVGGQAARASATDIATFPTQWGVPVLWGALILGIAVLLIARRYRRATAAMVLMLAVQGVFWIVFTHRQSRFMLPGVLPACVLIGLALGILIDRRAGLARGIGSLSAVALPVLLVGVSVMCLWTLARPMVSAAGEPVTAPPWQWVDTIREPTTPGQDSRGGNLRGSFRGDFRGVNDHPINHLPAGSKTLVVADNGLLLYLDRPIVYASAFDLDPLGAIVREVGDDPAALAEALRQRGITHVWLSLPEARRLRASYGADPDVPMSLLRRLSAAWPSVTGASSLHAVPGGP